MVMEQEKLVQSHGILLSVMEFYPFCPQIVPNLYFLVATKKLSSDLESLHLLMFSAKCRECKIRKKKGHGKSRSGQGKVMEKYFVKSVGTLHGETA